MKRSVVFATFIISVCTLTFFTIASATESALPQEKQNGRVAGVVLDVNNARVARATVTIESKGFSQEVITGDSGEFEANLPAGEYWFTVEANGFCKFEGDLLRVRPNTTEIMNVHLEVVVLDGPPDGCKCSSRSRKR
jgi:hypothetical protein